MDVVKLGDRDKVAIAKAELDSLTYQAQVVRAKNKMYAEHGCRNVCGGTSQCLWSVYHMCHMGEPWRQTMDYEGNFRDYFHKLFTRELRLRNSAWQLFGLTFLASRWLGHTLRGNQEVLKIGKDTKCTLGCHSCLSSCWKFSSITG